MDNRDAHANNLRIGRHSQPYGLYYITKRTDRHFVLWDSQRSDVIAALVHVRKQNHCLLHAFVIMPDHWHALFSLSDNWPLDKVILGVGKHASYNSRKHGIPMPWQDGYHDHKLRPSETVLEYIQYIENNPLKAGMVENAVDWAWSSAREEYRDHLDRDFLGHERWGK